MGTDEFCANTSIISSILSGPNEQFSPKALFSLASSTLKGEALKKHYKAYPATPDGYAAWAEKAMKLWEKAGSMADTVKDA